MGVDRTTIETYDRSAEALAEYFKGIGPRTQHIDRALELVGMAPNTARVVEIGCGDGRDAEAIVQRVAEYTGFDPSVGLLRLARQRLPDATFVQADSLSFDYPSELDVVFAFAALIHSDVDTNTKVFQKLRKAVRIGGIVLVNVRERDEYAQELQTDQFGTRNYYYYTPRVITQMAGDCFAAEYEDHQQIGSNTWLTMALRRIG